MEGQGYWNIVRRLRYTPRHRIHDGLPQFGFQLNNGHAVLVEYTAGFIGLIHQGTVLWTAGRSNPGLAAVHVDAPLHEPRFISAIGNKPEFLVSDGRSVWRTDLSNGMFTVVTDSLTTGLTEVGNAVWTPSGVWINDIEGHQVICIDAQGVVKERVGDGISGFQLGIVSFGEARFGRIFDLRAAPDGRVWVLDSSNYALRVIDPQRRTVSTVCGDGTPGYRGDGFPAEEGRLGGNPDAYFDGPWSIVVTPGGDVIIGDTQNRSVRRVDSSTGVLHTIAHHRMRLDPTVEGPLDPFVLICGMDIDPHSGALLVSDWTGEDEDELLVLIPPLDLTGTTS